MKKEIKVIGVISSARVNGNTATLVREALKGAEAEGGQQLQKFSFQSTSLHHVQDA